MGWIQRRRPAGMALSVLFQVLLVLIGCSAPRLIEIAAGSRSMGYNLLYAFDPFTTLDEVLSTNGLPAEVMSLYLLVLGLAGVLFVVNLPSVVREIRQVREAAPPRVAEDEAALHPQPAPAPRSPWD